MCFFKPKMPAPVQPPEKPAITETSAPEPQALVIGGGEAATTDQGEGKGKKGQSALKIDLTAEVKAEKESGDANTDAGANTDLERAKNKTEATIKKIGGKSTGGVRAAGAKAKSKGPTMY
ncbi:hypothetical protein CJ97_gp34 [Ralstonia phage RSB2]|uniref:Uncharacterized protein ORF34 n=1 Tax=Ralstonia phage RSB2 TaxID=913183 RepID=E5RV14_9CAUD|nr:hypothetical protein CJ97_gp34 [Ralstonia phage RSB2]BAJ51822.1 hypothetical protein [Ralstonia phage RSB2]